MSKIKTNKKKRSKVSKSVQPSPRVKSQKAPSKQIHVFDRIGTKYFLIAAIIITLIGFLLRVLNVGSVSLWVDEYVHAQGVRDFIAGKGGLFPYDDNGSLLNIFILPLFYLFGETDFWGRIPAVLFGAGSVYIAYLVGKKLVNSYLGLLTAILCAASLYLVFWSRLVRHYSLVEFFYLTLILVFLYTFHPTQDKIDKQKAFFKKFQLDLKYLIALPFIFLLALKSHNLALFFMFSLGLYCILMSIDALIRRDFQKSNYKYFVLGLPAFIGFCLMYTPPMIPITKDFLKLFLYDDFVDWQVPEWDIIVSNIKEKGYSILETYNNVMEYDNGPLYYIGLLGFLSAFFIKRKLGYFLLCFYALPLLLMSFIYTETVAPRYIVYIYPLFLLSIATGLYSIFILPFEYFLPNLLKHKYALGLLVIPIILVIVLGPKKELNSLVAASKRSGYLVDRKLTKWSFVDWKKAAYFVRAQSRPGDLFISTIPVGLKWYLKTEETIPQFRQRYWNVQQRSYATYEDDPNNFKSANSVTALKRTIDNNQRGWILADYYINTTVVDPQARNLVYQNLDFHWDGYFGDVMVFSWDNSTPRVQNQTFVIALGRDKNKIASRELTFNINEQLLTKPQLDVRLWTQAINSKEEAYLVINKKVKIFIPKNDSKYKEMKAFQLKSEYFQKGSNIIQFGYNTEVFSDADPGYAVYHIEIN